MHYEGQLTWTRTQDRDLCHFKPLWLGAILLCFDGPAIEVKLFHGRFSEHQWNVGKHRRSFWVLVCLLIFYLWLSKHDRKPHFQPSLQGCISSKHVLLLILSYFLYNEQCFRKLYKSLITSFTSINLNINSTIKTIEKAIAQIDKIVKF